MEEGNIHSEVFGTTSDGKQVTKYTLKNAKGIQVDIIDLGGIITSILVPDQAGGFDDITTGYDSVQEYETKPAYFGALIGRVANRIHKGEFSLEGQDYKLAVNNGPNHLHGGIVGFNKKVWHVTEKEGALCLGMVSSDGEEGYPGEVTVTVTYSLTEQDELHIDYSAVSTKATPINLTNHAYFNLAGHKANDVYDHTVTINADRYTPKTEEDVPTGELADVSGSLLDFREPVLLGSRLNKVAGAKPGVDHNFCVNGTGDKKLAASVVHAASGRVMEVYTDQPGIQFYTGNYLDGIAGKDGAVYKMHSCLALESQNYPDAVHQPSFPSCILKPGETYRHRTWYKFSVSA